uniref:Uncharacterized protein n=1 Tax=Cacopsylla melanoneura TaxID=428564 RepID=A0A8D8SXB8_9HEMI
MLTELEVRNGCSFQINNTIFNQSLIHNIFVVPSNRIYISFYCNNILYVFLFLTIGFWVNNALTFFNQSLIHIIFVIVIIYVFLFLSIFTPVSVLCVDNGGKKYNKL